MPASRRSRLRLADVPNARLCEKASSPGHLKLLISTARVNDRLYACADPCTCSREACRSPQLAPRDGDHVPMSRLSLRRHHRSVINGPATKALYVNEVQEVEGSI
jgi:hypothetical protein